MARSAAVVSLVRIQASMEKLPFPKFSLGLLPVETLTKSLLVSILRALGPHIRGTGIGFPIHVPWFRPTISREVVPVISSRGHHAAIPEGGGVQVCPLSAENAL